ncbi:MAG: CBS domain-containing protein [Kouleothrix sp.]
MTRQVYTVAPDMPVMQVAQILLEQRIGGIPVLEGQQIVGMITESDLFRLIVRRHIGACAGLAGYTPSISPTWKGAFGSI